MENETNFNCPCNSPFCPENSTEIGRAILTQFNNIDEATLETIFELFDSFDIVDHQPMRDVISDDGLSAILDLFENPSWALWERQFLNV
jgi:hypothetical protein